MRAVGPDHVAALLGREAAQHGLDPLLRAPAGIAHRLRFEHRHAPLVEQSVEQPLARQRRVDEFVVLHGLGQGLGLAPALVLARLGHEIGRRIARMEIGLAAALFGPGQELDQDAARPPARSRAGDVLGHR